MYFTATISELVVQCAAVDFRALKSNVVMQCSKDEPVSC